jgi:hypothetical protein
MKRVLGAIIIFALVLGFRFPSFGNETAKKIGRFQIVAPTRASRALLEGNHERNKRFG